jgi:hypothetical protein
MSRTISLIVLALVTAAVAAPIASSGSPAAPCSQADNPSGCYRGKPFVDPLGVSYQAFFAQRQTGSRVTSPTQFVDPLAISYLTGMGLTPAQIKDWTVGVCAHAKKPAVCFAPFQHTSASTPTVASSSDFKWGDATIGAAATLGTVLLLGGIGAILVTSRNGRRRTIASA